MDSNNRKSNDDKAYPIHNWISMSKNGVDLNLLKLVRKMNEDQQVKNWEFELCIMSLTEMVKGSNLKVDNQSGGCWSHNHTNHDILVCYKFKTEQQGKIWGGKE